MKKYPQILLILLCLQVHSTHAVKKIISLNLDCTTYEYKGVDPISAKHSLFIEVTETTGSVTGNKSYCGFFYKGLKGTLTPEIVQTSKETLGKTVARTYFFALEEKFNLEKNIKKCPLTIAYLFEEAEEMFW